MNNQNITDGLKRTLTTVPPSDKPKSMRITRKAGYEVTNAVEIEMIPKAAMVQASHTDPKCLRARFDGMSENMYYRHETEG